MSRWLRSTLAAAAIVAAALGGMLAQTAGVLACTIGPPLEAHIPEHIQRAPVVAIGTWVRSTERVAVFRVDEALKGTTPGEQFRVDNRGTYTSAACSPYDEEPHSGFRFAEGERSVLVLQAEVEGLWQVSFWGLAAFDVPATGNDGMVMDWYALAGHEQPIEGAPTLASVREASAAPSLAPERTPNPGGYGARLTSPLALTLLVAMGLGVAFLAHGAIARARRDRR